MMFQFAEERLSNMRLVKAFAKESLEERKYAEKVDNVLRIANKEVIGHSFFYMMVILSMFHDEKCNQL